MSNLLSKWFLHKILFLAWLLVTASPALLLVWFHDAHKDKIPNVTWLTAPWGLVAFIVSWWVGKTTAHYIVDENKSPLDATKWALCEIRFKLVFLPLIGPLFEPDEDKTRNDDIDD